MPTAHSLCSAGAKRHFCRNFIRLRTNPVGAAATQPKTGKTLQRPGLLVACRLGLRGVGLERHFLRYYYLLFVCRCIFFLAKPCPPTTLSQCTSASNLFVSFTPFAWFNLSYRNPFCALGVIRLGFFVCLHALNLEKIHRLIQAIK